MSEEVILHGGNVNEIVRIGDTVHRKQGNRNVHNLLRHLELQGFEGVPRFFGVDEQGREVLSFIAGEVPGNDYPNCKPYVWSDRTLQAVGVFLRKYHDATRSFMPQAIESKWVNPYLDEDCYEVICHNDAALYNFVFRDEMPVALIDFDTASPGACLWDIAYTLYTAIPLSSFEPEQGKSTTIAYNTELHASNRRRRIDMFLNAYGLEAPINMKMWVLKRITALCDTLKKGAEQGNRAFQKMIDEGHLLHYENEIAFLQKHFHDWYN